MNMKKLLWAAIASLVGLGVYYLGNILLERETKCITITGKYIDRGTYKVDTDNGVFNIYTHILDTVQNGQDWSNLTVGKTYTVESNVYGAYTIYSIKGEGCNG